jgi:nuclear pore complex protein Nup188
MTHPSFLDSPQNKNGDGLPSAVTPRAQRPSTTTTTTTTTTALATPAGCSSKQPTADTEASEQRALHTVQYGLLKILSRTLAALRHFTPDVCQILLDQVLVATSKLRLGSHNKP